MGVFDLTEIGQIAMMQTIIMMVGLMQLGLLSGAYILWAEGDVKTNKAMVNVLYLWKFALALLFCVALGLIGLDNLSTLVMPEVLVIGLIAGIAQIGSTWISNALVAEQKLLVNSSLNVIAITVSFTMAITTIGNKSLVIALCAIALQPLILIAGAIIYQPRFRPEFRGIDCDVLARMCKLGIQPFLGSLAILLLYQLERWSILAYLGTEQLGRYYIVIIYLSFFVVIPAALLNVHFPRAKKALNQGEMSTFRNIQQQHMRELGAFATIALVVQVLFLETILEFWLPQYTASLYLLNLAFLAGSIGMMQDLATLILFSLNKTRPVLICGVIALSIFAGLLVILQFFESFTLEAILIARVVATTASGAWLLMTGHIALSIYAKTRRP
jgi:O-antigen/teichoic acid export membrane protein